MLFFIKVEGYCGLKFTIYLIFLQKDCIRRTEIQCNGCILHKDKTQKQHCYVKYNKRLR